MSIIHLPIKPTSIYLHKPRDQFFSKYQPPFKDVQKNTTMSCSGRHSIFLLFWKRNLQNGERVFSRLFAKQDQLSSPPGEPI